MCEYCLCGAYSYSGPVRQVARLILSMLVRGLRNRLSYMRPLPTLQDDGIESARLQPKMPGQRVEKIRPNNNNYYY